MSCWRCGGSGEVVECPDDLCNGTDHCIHGDGKVICSECGGVPDDEYSFESYDDEERCDDIEVEIRSHALVLTRRVLPIDIGPIAACHDSDPIVPKPRSKRGQRKRTWPNR